MDLRDIEGVIARLQSEHTVMNDEIASLSNQFFTLVPQPSHRSSAIHAIADENSAKKYLAQILQFLDLHVTKKLLLGCQLDPSRIHPIDYVYRGLGARLQRLERTSREMKWIEDYVYASGHSRLELEIYNVFAVNRRGEDERFRPFLQLENRTLLWHGSGLVNFNGILSSGLRIAPPGADVSGYALGKGIYFADSFAKSYGYCRDFQGSFGFLGGGLSQSHYSRNKKQAVNSPTKCLLLCEVALGTSYLAHRFEYMERAKDGTHSTKAVGSSAPDPKKVLTTPNGVIIPNGSIVNVPVPNDWKPLPPPAPQNYHCASNNEFVIYDEGQCRMKYLVEVGAPRPAYLKWLESVEKEKSGRCKAEQARRMSLGFV